MTRLHANGTMLRLRSLVGMGHSAARLARALGVSERLVQRLIGGLVATVDPELRDRVRELHDAIWDLRPPERTPAERAAASAARRRAAEAGWCAPAGLDDDALDEDTTYRPTHPYMPALGTGIAPDFPPEARRSA
jgi:hypothetical protein